MNPIILHLDRSAAPCGLCLERDGQRVTIDDALREGFVVSADDAPAMLTAAARHVEARDEYSK